MITLITTTTVDLSLAELTNMVKAMRAQGTPEKTIQNMLDGLHNPAAFGTWVEGLVVTTFKLVREGGDSGTQIQTP